MELGCLYTQDSSNFCQISACCAHNCDVWLYTNGVRIQTCAHHQIFKAVQHDDQTIHLIMIIASFLYNYILIYKRMVCIFITDWAMAYKWLATVESCSYMRNMNFTSLIRKSSCSRHSLCASSYLSDWIILHIVGFLLIFFRQSHRNLNESVRNMNQLILCRVYQRQQQSHFS